MQQGPAELRPASVPAGAKEAIHAWNFMGGEIRWEALDVVAELYGVDDVEVWLARLVIIRDSQRTD